MRMAPLTLFLILIGGCASRPPSVETPPTPPRAAPVQAMESCAVQAVRDACRFRPDFASLTEEEQFAEMRGCFEVIGPKFRECAEKHDGLRDFIQAPTPGSTGH